MIQKLADKSTSRQIRDLQEKLREERAVNLLATQIISCNTIEEVLHELANSCVNGLGFGGCVLYGLVDPIGPLLIPKAVRFLKKTIESISVATAVIKSGSEIISEVAQRGVAEIISDVALDTRYRRDENHLGSAIFVPLADNGKVWGVVHGLHPQKNFFQPKHLSILKAMAALCTQQIKHLELAAAHRAIELQAQENHQQKAEAKLLALRLQLSPHFIFNSLNSINNFILHNETEQASGFLTKFSRLMRQAMVNAKSEWVTLRSELKALQLYLDLEQMRCNGQLQISLDTQEVQQLDQWQVPSLITYPFVENAIWHGLLPLQDRRPELKIVCKESASCLIILIEDNGVGRSKSTTSRTSALTAHKSHGIKITEERLQLVNELFPVEATLQILDLFHPEGTPAGTRVTIFLKK